MHVHGVALCRRQQVREDNHLAKRLATIYIAALASEIVELDFISAVDVVAGRRIESIDMLVVARIVALYLRLIQLVVPGINAATREGH